MRDTLRDICNLNGHNILSEVTDLTTQWKEYIGDVLEYACCFWTKHLLEAPGSGSHVEEVQKTIDQFFTTCLLFWVETLSLMENLSVGVHALNDIEKWYAFKVSAWGSMLIFI